MGSRQEFGKSLLIMQAEDSALAATLRKDEALVTASVGKMQGKIDTLALGQANLAASVSVAAAAVSALGAAASATGNQALATAATVATFGVALGAMASAAVASAAGMKALTMASLAFVATPLGVVLLAVAAAAAAVAAVWHKSNQEQREATALADKAAEKLKAQTEAIDKQADALERQIKLLKGTKPSELEGNLRLRNLLMEKEVLEVANKLRSEEETRGKALSDRIRVLERETQIISGQKTALDFIADAGERAATAARDRAKATKEAADAAKAEAQAAASLRRSQGFLTPAEARERVNLAATEQVGALVRQAALRAAFADRFNLDLQFKLAELDSSQRRLAEALGLRGGGDAARQIRRGGAIASTAFTTGRAGLFAAIQAPDPAQIKRNRESTDTAKAVRETANNTKQIARAVITGSGLGQ